MTPPCCGPTGGGDVHLRFKSGGGGWLAGGGAVVTGVLALVLAAGCTQPSARPYVGHWERQVDTTGTASLTIKPTGAFELQLPHPVQPGAGLMKGPGFFHADTVVFTGASCESGDARYQLSLRDSLLSITALGADGCALRRSTLSGEWVRR
jgi:hypothetical protein